MRDVIVVGAGPAGARCAERLAEDGRARVTLIGAEPALPYNRVALSRLLASEVEESSLVTHDNARLNELGVRYLSGARAEKIDRTGRTVTVDSGAELPYADLVLALGAQPIRLRMPGADLHGVLAYRSLDDVRAMIAASRSGGQAVVIGGGLLGLEAAYGLARRGMSVIVLHAVDRLMERQLDHAASALLIRRMKDLDIAVKLKASAQSIEGTGRAQAVMLSCGTRIAADLVVMSVGIRPETRLAAEAGLTVARGIVVDNAMRTSDSHIFAIGECAEHDSQCCGLVAPALAQAEVAARVLRGEIACYAPEATAAALKVAGARVWSAGEIDPLDGEPIVLDDSEGSEYRKFFVRDGRLIGAMLYGETADAPWYLDLIASGRPVQGFRHALPFGRAMTEALA